MRNLLSTTLVLLAALILCAPGLALEKTAAVAPVDLADRDWAAGTTCSISYYNICTGWIWLWSGWSAGDVVGMVLEPCCPPDNDTFLVGTDMYAWSSTPSGYGFTGTVGIWDAPGGCPTALLAAQPLLPVSGLNTLFWGVPVTGTHVLAYEHGISAFPDPTIWVSDHPAAGPTGPAACGFCYPTTRVAHSFYFGTVASPLCPGSTLNDGVCDSEWYGWFAAYACEPVSVDPSSWGSIKNLYR